ncbi:Rieske (2Fe-2S) protein [Mycobacterium sp.]|uniref:Rieske (2Fe-2S) protein n=1 Tax=Mycobacterium sp. TaxID=1785 RepID=UPI002BB28AD4|nr:Rieske (2Fe-2S) protein [Mycobacterium sp.]HKP40933.1 Rieske (2Fe-2S) protein [Mycobacterium sp.]
MGLPSMRPTGWFQVAWSADLEVGDVKPLQYFGADLVAFRDLDGAVHVLDAYCQHLGADLSHGGCVVEGGIQCPFHGWVWSGDDGHNVRIPYEPQPDGARYVRSWNVTELNECIYIWHDLGRHEPVWPVPDARQELGSVIGSQYFRPIGPDERQFFAGVTVHPQVIAESSVDRQHHRFVHHVPVSPIVLAASANESSWHASIGFGKGDPVQITWYGVGLSLNCECHGDGIQVISICPTPVDDVTTDIFATYWISENLDYDYRLEAAKRMLLDDIDIWAHQQYLDRPGLAPSEADDFTHLREWASGFYPQAQPERRNVTL